MTTIGIIGVGNIGSQLARLALANGHDVVLSNSRGPQTLTGLVADLAGAAEQFPGHPGVRAATAADAGESGDVVVVTIPLKNHRDVPVEPLAGKLVIDTNNYYPERDGHPPALDDESTTTAELSQRHLLTSKVVKAFNNILAADLTEEGTTAGTPNRRALPIAGDDEEATATVAELIGRFGFDVVDAGSLAEGWRFQRDTPAYVAGQNSGELTANVAAAKWYRDL